MVKSYMRLKKIKAAAGWIGKENSPGRSSGNKSIFFLWPYWYFDVEYVWVEFGCRKDCKPLPIYLYAKALEEKICVALPFWYDEDTEMFARLRRTSEQ